VAAYIEKRVFESVGSVFGVGMFTVTRAMIRSCQIEVELIPHYALLKS
jgi:hypothetical protein